MTIEVDALMARIRARKKSGDCADGDAVDSDLETLVDALVQARAEVRRLTEEDEDLRGSAEIWVQLYDASIQRANTAEAELKRLRRDLPANVQQLYEAMDRVDTLTEAIAGVVRECEVCARHAQDKTALAERTSEACIRCKRALDLLQSAAGFARLIR